MGFLQKLIIYSTIEILMKRLKVGLIRRLKNAFSEIVWKERHVSVGYELAEDSLFG